MVNFPAPAEPSSTSLLEWVQTHLTLLHPALDLDVKEFDRKARIDKLELLSTDLHGGRVTIRYRLSFSAMYTCAGIDYESSHERQIEGQVTGDSWIFPEYRPLPARSTADEL